MICKLHKNPRKRVFAFLGLGNGRENI
ncbi:UNVERIFIED_ORG: hypothetical protein J2Y77_005356 [Pseudomonas lini]